MKGLQFFSMGLMGCSLVAQAATQPPAPVSAKDLTAASPSLTLHAPELTPKTEVAPIVLAKPSVREAKLPANFRFTLQSAVVLGSHALPAEQVSAVVKRFVGKQVRGQDLKQLAKEITELYHQAGYVTSRCFIPPQKIQNGRVVLQVEEDKLVDLDFSGEHYFDYDKRFFAQFISDLRGKIIHLPTLRERLQKLIRIPAQKIQPKLVKVGFGASKLVLQITPLPDQKDITLSNMGSRYTGQERLAFTGDWANVEGRGDRLQLSLQTALNPKRFSSAAVLFDYPVGVEAGALRFSLSRLDYELDPKEVGYSAVRYQGSSEAYGVAYHQPWLLQDRINHWLKQEDDPLPIEAQWEVGVDLKDSRSDTVYDQYFSVNNPAGYRYSQGRDKLFVPSIGMQLQHPDQLFSLAGMNHYQVKFVTAIEGFLGSMTQDEIRRKQENIQHNVEPIKGPIGDVSGMKAGFSKLYFTYLRQQSLPKEIQLQVKFHWEYTPDKKVPSDYKFVPAGGGAKGYSLNIGATRLFAKDLTLGAGLMTDTATNYYQGTATVCGKTKTVNGEASCTDSKGYLTAHYEYQNWHLDAQYFTSVADYDPNGLNFRVALGYRW